MRYTYGIIDRRKVLLYKPQLFLKDKDLLIFSSRDFLKWHSDIKEYIDGIYQIDSWEIEGKYPISVNELNLAVAVLNNIIEELESFFDSKKTSNSSHHYISTLDEKYKKIRSPYTSDMKRIDMRIPVITMEMKYQHVMEIVNKANMDFSHARQKVKDSEDKQDKKKGY